MDEARTHEITHQVWQAINLGGDVRARVVDLITDVGLDDICKLYALWVGSSVGLFNVMSAVEVGMRMDESQLSGSRDIVRRHAMGREGEGITELIQAYRHVSNDQLDQLGAAFGRVWATDPHGAADMLTLAALVLRAAVNYHNVPPVQMSLRAASLRTHLVDTRKAMKEVEWCDDCLPKAADIIALTDDRKVTIPMDGAVTRKDDMSFLNGIDLGGFDGGKKDA